MSRDPLPRRGDDMDLPEGKTCSDCVYVRRCAAMFGHIPEDMACDWSPSRFRQAQPSVPASVSVERCESGDPGCGPVEFHDDDGVPLCRRCYHGLDSETRAQRKARERGIELLSLGPGASELAATDATIPGCCGDSSCNQGREQKMAVLVPSDENGRGGVWCDPCIAPLIAALNAAGLRTIASCCGHGHRPPSVGLANGQWLVIARDDAERRRIDTLFPVDINGDTHAAPAASGDGLLERLEQEADRREYVPTNKPVLSPPSRYRHPERLRALLHEAANTLRRLSGQGDAQRWQLIETLGCNDGVVLLYSAQWVDADFNPEGIREGFRNEGPGGPVLSARWCASHDLWETDEESDATHWRKRPAAPEQQEGR